MTEKRFEYTAYDDGTESIYDRKKDEYYFDSEFCKLDEVLNELNDENDELKQQLADIDRLIYDLGHDEMRRQYEEIFKGDVE